MVNLTENVSTKLKRNVSEMKIKNRFLLKLKNIMFT